MQLISPSAIVIRWLAVWKRSQLLGLRLNYLEKEARLLFKYSKPSLVFQTAKKITHRRFETLKLFFLQLSVFGYSCGQSPTSQIDTTSCSQWLAQGFTCDWNEANQSPSWDFLLEPTEWSPACFLHLPGDTKGTGGFSQAVYLSVLGSLCSENE